MEPGSPGSPSLLLGLLPGFSVLEAFGWDVACCGIAQAGQAAKGNPSRDKQPDEMTALSKNVLSHRGWRGMDGGFLFTGSFPRNSSDRKEGHLSFCRTTQFVSA